MVYLSLARPQAADAERALAQSLPLGFNYPAADVGMTRGGERTDYACDHSRVRLGSGEAVYEAARAALGTWKQFQLGWAFVDPATPVRSGGGVCVCARTFLLWTRNPLQVVFTDAQPSKTCRKRFAFAHGTLEGHLLAGEERFAVELSREGEVFYDIRALSRPGCLLARLAYPLARAQQSRFARDSLAAMLAATGRGPEIADGAVARRPC